MPSSPLVSITVPVYNVEKYIRKCLESLANQTLSEVEFILVDDGSTDRSGVICDEFAARDSRFKVIHQVNGGLSSARQTGLQAATGEYIITCDSDDWVEPDMYECLYLKAIESEADIIFCDYWIEYNDGRRAVSVYGLNPTSRNDLLDDALNGCFPPQVWSKMIKRELFTKYALSWEPGINLGEDFLITLKMLQCDVKVAYLPVKLYHYRRTFGEESYTNTITMNTFHQSYYIRQWVMENLDVEKYASGMFRLWMALSFTALRVKEGMSEEYYRTEVLTHVPYNGFFKYHYPKLKGAIVLFAKLFGYKPAKFVYKLMYKHFYR